MPTPTFENLRETLQQLRRRRSQLFFLKQGSLHMIAVALLVLGMSLLAVWLEPGKAGLLVLFALAVALGVAILYRFYRLLQLRHTDDRALAHYVEDHIPDFEQRLLTSLEFTEEDLQKGRAGVSTQFIRQLWEDAQVHVKKQQRQVEAVTPVRDSWISFASALAIVGITTLAFLSSEVLLQAGSRLAWPFAIEEPIIIVEIPPDIEISVEPGDVEMQRGESLTIIARVNNAMPEMVNLRLQDDNVNWRDVPMSRDGTGSDSAS